MSLLNSINCFLQIFYKLGLSPKFNSSENIVTKTPLAILSFLVSLLVSVGGGVLINFYITDEKSVEITMSNLFLLCEIIKFCSIFVQSFFYCDIMVEIFSNFDSIHALFINSLYWRIDYAPLNKSFSKKFCVVIFGFLQNLISFLFENIPPRSGILTSLVFKSWQFMSTIALIHIVFYIDLLNYHLLQLNMVVRNDARDRSVHGIILANNQTHKEISILKKIKCYKNIYYRLWEILQKINFVFGWSIVALLLQAFCDATFVSYWLYSSLREHRHITGIIRECNKIISDFSLW